MNRCRLLFFYMLFPLTACSVGHKDYIDFRNDEIGTEIPYREPFKFKNSGELVRGDFVRSGEGLTHITKDESGDLIYHIFDQEVLANYPKKEWIGKCLTYYKVDPQSYIIKSWGFDKGGNPLSCRTWP